MGLEKKLKINEDEVWLDPAQSVTSYIKKHADEGIKFKKQKLMFENQPEYFVKDYLVARVMELEPFIVQALNLVDQQMTRMKGYVDQQVSSYGEIQR